VVKTLILIVVSHCEVSIFLLVFDRPATFGLIGLTYGEGAVQNDGSRVLDLRFENIRIFLLVETGEDRRSYIDRLFGPDARIDNLSFFFITD
jgi:hypothetical protein